MIATSNATTAAETGSDSGASNQRPGARDAGTEPLPRPLFTAYGFSSRTGDGRFWHHAGHLRDTWRVWSTFVWLLVRHPLIMLRGMRVFFVELFYRLSISDGQAAFLSRFALPLAVLAPLLMAPLTFLLAALPVPKPEMFRPFTVLGLMNYCVMLVVVSAFHTSLRLKHNVSPKQSRQYASKKTWRELFQEHLSDPAAMPVLYATIQDHELHGTLPEASFVVKPLSAGAGYRLRGFWWSQKTSRYRLVERCPGDTITSLTQGEMRRFLQASYSDAVIESWEQTRRDLPISTLRVLTVRFAAEAELLGLALLVAPGDSISTAHAHVHPYRIDVEARRVMSSYLFDREDGVCGVALPELDEILPQCLRLHEALPLGQVEVSWDIMLTSRGPVYLEGNIIPPGCDYKVLVFQSDDNLKYFLNRYLEALQDPTQPPMPSFRS